MRQEGFAEKSREGLLLADCGRVWHVQRQLLVLLLEIDIVLLIEVLEGSLGGIEAPMGEFVPIFRNYAFELLNVDLVLTLTVSDSVSARDDGLAEWLIYPLQLPATSSIT